VAGLLCDRRDGAGRRVDREASGGAERIVADGDARHAQIADHQEVRRLPQIEPRVVDERERAADEVHGHEPALAAARRRRGQRDQPSGDGRERLVRRQDNRLAFVRNRDRAERFLAHGQLEGGREIVEGDKLLITNEGDGQRAAAVLRQQRECRRLSRLTRQNCGQTDQKGGGGNGRETGMRAGVQWRISESRDPPLYQSACRPQR
jgi:hypothetical protein